MKIIPLLVATTFSTLLFAQPEQSRTGDGLITYSNRPLGSPDRPLLLRTFMPDPGLGAEVLSRHGLSSNSPKYSPAEGKDVPGVYKPIDGLPAAIGVNHGGAFSYCWDTIECRLLYAWKDGFLDMKSYWGDPERGSRRSSRYVPHLVGTIYYQASGKDPLLIDGKSVSDLSLSPKFVGYETKDSGYTFTYRAGGVDVHCEIKKGETENSLIIRYKTDTSTVLGYKSHLTNHEVQAVSSNELIVNIQGSKLAEYRGNPEADLLAGGVNLASGKRIFSAMACGTCHSLDGSASHGPSLLGIHGKTRMISGSDQPVTMDDAYILESIKDPNAKIAEGYPKNYMPPYVLKEGEYQALLLYLKSITVDP